MIVTWLNNCKQLSRQNPMTCTYMYIYTVNDYTRSHMTINFHDNDYWLSHVISDLRYIFKKCITYSWYESFRAIISTSPHHSVWLPWSWKINKYLVIYVHACTCMYISSSFCAVVYWGTVLSWHCTVLYWAGTVLYCTE